MAGKVLGALVGVVAGLLLESPGLAVGLGALGLLLGHLIFDREGPGPQVDAPRYVDELLDEPRPRRRLAAPRRRDTLEEMPAIPSPEEETLARRLGAVFVEVARADGPVTRAEVRVIRELFEGPLAFSEGGLEALRVALKASLSSPVADIVDLVKEARGHLKPQVRLDVVRGLYDVALLDGKLARSEADLLRRVVQHLNLSDEQLQAITAEFFGGGEADYGVLGLSPQATDEEIKAAFRRLAAENHPDRVAAQAPADAAQAADRFRKIKDAYEALRTLRGL